MANRLHIADVLKSDDLTYLRILWCDNGNVIRSKSIHLPSLKRHLHNNGWEELKSEEFLYKIEESITNTIVLAAVDAVFDEPVPEAGLEPVKEIRLVPDWDTLVMLPYAPGHAQTISTLMLDSTDVPWELCPRGLLSRTVDKAQKMGYDVMCGAEIEFFLFEEEPFRTEGKLEPVDNTNYSQNSAFDRSREVIDEISACLFDMNIELAHYNAETGPGQHEISLHYTDPLTLADRIVYTREAMKAVAHEYGLIVSIAPKIIQDTTGSGCHLHLSLWSEGRDILGVDEGDQALSPQGEAFIAGVLEHLPGLMVFTTPTLNSFRRIEPKFWSGAYQVWGWDNKEAAIRVLRNPFGGGPNQFELKTMDCSANPYIALTGVITAGLDGLSKKLTLPEPLQRDPGNLTDKEREKLGVKLLPVSLEDALSELEKDSVLKDALGEEFYRIYTAMRRFEAEERGDYDLEKEVGLILTLY